MKINSLVLTASLASVSAVISEKFLSVTGYRIVVTLVFIFVTVPQVDAQLNYKKHNKEISKQMSK